jgi:uncharacterized protein involved in type VI secretion and phage assembly
MTGGDVPVDGGALRHFGVYPAIVTDVVDPDNLGRIEVKLPWLGRQGDADVRLWATLCTPYADDDQGLMVLPAVDTQVVVAFEAGDLRRPYIIGSCWNGLQALPGTPQQSNDKRLLKTRSGSLLEFDDTPGASKVTLAMRSGHTLVLDDAIDEVALVHANGASISIDVTGAIRISCNSTVEVSGPMLNVHTPVATFDGIINCTTIICSAGVVSPSYTPGAGNVW